MQSAMCQCSFDVIMQEIVVKSCVFGTTFEWDKSDMEWLMNKLRLDG